MALAGVDPGHTGCSRADARSSADVPVREQVRGEKHNIETVQSEPSQTVGRLPAAECSYRIKNPSEACGLPRPECVFTKPREAPVTPERSL